MFKRLFKCLLLIAALLPLSSQIQARTITSADQLRYGTVLFDYYQGNFFSALVEAEYAQASKNPQAFTEYAQVFEGGMRLSYGLSKQAQGIFQKYLHDQGYSDELAHNRAWFYLARLLYRKGQASAASRALTKVSGHIPEDIHGQYHYLATLVNLQGKHLGTAETVIGGALNGSAYEPYLLYNLAVSQLRAGEPTKAKSNFQKVTAFTNEQEDLAVLADRARHGLAELAVSEQNWLGAWLNLQDIRTSGLYSNRALLSYGWSAINTKQYEQAIPALQLLGQRSIAIAEVQETKVLLPHLYEQKGASRQALKAYLLAEKEFAQGLQLLQEARDVIATRDVPEEFVSNLDLVAADSDWNGTQPNVNYQKLTPFLIDLMASNGFQSTLKELADLYALRKNLQHWRRETERHQVILNRRRASQTNQQLTRLVEQQRITQERLSESKLEMKLTLMSLDEPTQARFSSQIERAEKELHLLNEKINKIADIQSPYQHTQLKVERLKSLHLDIDEKLVKVNGFIAQLEPVMRSVVNAELDKHQERMNYYWAQARLAKARLYDATLLSLEATHHQREVKH